MIPYTRHTVDLDDEAAVLRVLRSDRLTQGEEVPAFERELAIYCGSRFCVAVSSGTAALHLACLAAGLGPGDAAIVPAVTFVATANAVEATGARARVCDVAWGTWNLEAMTARSERSGNCKAVLPVYFAGLPCEMDQLVEWGHKRGLTVIADAAHALGATYKGRRLGEMGADMTCLSFHAAKHITTAGEGGAVLTNDVDLDAKLRALRDHGRPADGKVDGSPWWRPSTMFGLNYRMSEIAAAMGRSQLTKADRWLRQRRRIAAEYYAWLAHCDGVIRPAAPARHAWHLFPIWLDPERYDRAHIYREFHKRGVGVQVHYEPIHRQPHYRDRYGDGFPNAERFAAGCLSLPIYPAMTDADVEHVIKAVRAVLC